jgi:hypothetical protein
MGVEVGSRPFLVLSVDLVVLKNVFGLIRELFVFRCLLKCQFSSH